MPDKEIILEARSLRKEFGGLVAVTDVSLKVERGSLHSIIGPNGAGKTTLMNLLSGLYAPTRGEIILKGRDITHVPLHRRAHLGIGRSFQITNIFPNLTVLENVRLAAQALGHVNFNFFRRADHYKNFIDRAMTVIDLVGLRAEASIPATILPHGGKRKLELAILLAAEPEILILDEPTAGMASEQVPELMNTIQAVREGADRTILLVEHNMNVVMNASDWITVMHTGSVLAEGAPADIATNKAVQSAYLGELYSDLFQASAEGGHG